MNLHKKRCENHKSRYISSVLKPVSGQVYIQNSLLVLVSYHEDTLTWGETENVFKALMIHVVVFLSDDWRTTKWKMAFRILYRHLSVSGNRNSFLPKSLPSVLRKRT
jgi:hypothetical protein